MPYIFTQLYELYLIILGIILGLFTVMYLAYRNWSIIWMVPIVAGIVVYLVVLIY